MRARTWIFDLDNTLHNARPHIYPHINSAMTAYLQAHLGLDEAAAAELRRHYWKRYGATLIGLIRHHATDPHHFLWHTHQFDNLERMLVHEPQLRTTLRRLRGRKVIFSNAPTHYSSAVLTALGIADPCDDVFTIARTRYRPTPDTSGFLRLCRAHRLNPRRCIMVEDTLENLRTAARLGMKTVWVTLARRAPAYVDVRITNLAQLPRMLATLQ